MSPQPPPAERVLARLKLYRDIFYVVWDVVVPLSGAGVAIYTLFHPELQDPQFYAAVGSLYGINGILRVVAAKRSNDGTPS